MRAFVQVEPEWGKSNITFIWEHMRQKVWTASLDIGGTASETKTLTK
jgi:hypothetical protein